MGALAEGSSGCHINNAFANGKRLLGIMPASAALERIKGTIAVVQGSSDDVPASPVAVSLLVRVPLLLLCVRVCELMAMQVSW